MDSQLIQNLVIFEKDLIHGQQKAPQKIQVEMTKINLAIDYYRMNTRKGAKWQQNFCRTQNDALWVDDKFYSIGKSGEMPVKRILINLLFFEIESKAKEQDTFQMQEPKHEFLREALCKRFSYHKTTIYLYVRNKNTAQSSLCCCKREQSLTINWKIRITFLERWLYRFKKK